MKSLDLALLTDGFKWGLDKGYTYLLEMDADFSHRFEDLVKYWKRHLLLI